MPHDKTEASRVAREAIEIVEQSQRRRPSPTGAVDRRRRELTQSTLRREFVTNAAARASRSQTELHDQRENAPTLEQRALAAVIEYVNADVGSPAYFAAIEEFWRIAGEENDQ